MQIVPPGFSKNADQNSPKHAISSEKFIFWVEAYLSLQSPLLAHNQAFYSPHLRPQNSSLIYAYEGPDPPTEPISRSEHRYLAAWHSGNDVKAYQRRYST